MSSNNSINSSTFTEVELSLIAMGLYLLISPIHGVSKITKPLLKMLNVKSPTSLLLFSGLLFGVIYYFSVKLVLGPLYNKIRKSGFKVGGQLEVNKEMKTELSTKAGETDAAQKALKKSNQAPPAGRPAAAGRPAGGP